MNITKTKSYYTSRLTRIAVLMALLMSSLSSMAYDFEVIIYSGKPMYFNIIGDNEVCITYKDTTYNSYDDNYTEDEYDWYTSNYGTEHWNCIGIPDEVTYNGKSYRVTAVGENAFRGCTSINKIDWGKRKYLKHIDTNAFRGCSSLKSVGLPPNLETISAHAFEGCSFIHVVSFPRSVNLIDTCAFMGCSRLKYIGLSSPVKIGPKAFIGTNLRGHQLTGGIAINCTSTTPPVLADSTVFDYTHYASSVVKVLYSLVELFRGDENWNRFVNIQRLPYDFSAQNSNYKTIYYRINNEHEVGVSPANEVYYGTYGYGNYNIPETVNYGGKTYRVTSVEYKAFYLSAQPCNVTLPNSVKRISDLAFGNSFVENVILGDSVETIGRGAFNACQITNIHFPKSVIFIGDSALYNTPELRTITVEDGNPVYDSREGCNALIETATNRLIAGGGYCTEIPSTVASITDYAFYGKSRLGRITIPGSIRRVGIYAFLACGNLSQVTLSEGIKCIGGGAFCFSGLTSVVIPNSVDTIEEAAFEASNKIKSVVLGSGMKYLGSRAFGRGNNAGASAIDTVICYAVMPPQMAATCFAGAYNRATLLVPLESITLYKADTNWSRFHKIRAIGVPEMPGDVNFDYEVNIADVNSLVDIILGGTDNSDGLSDVNGDGEVNIADINTIINLIISGE